MAFTPDQKAAIKKRAQELLATGMTTGEAAQQAYKEVSANTAVFPTPKSLAIENAELESRQTVQQLENTRAGYVDQRAEVLEKSGVEPEIARKRAENEFEKSYVGPLVTPYGELEERKAQKPLTIDIAAAPPTSVSRQPVTGLSGLGTALRPQTTLPKSAIEPERARAKEPAYAGLIGAGPDYTKIMKQLQDDGLTPQQASAQIAALQGAYNTNLMRKKNEAQKNKQVLPPDVLQTTWEETVKEISDIPKVLENKQGYVKDYKPTGPQDPLFLAFSKQVTAGEGVPNVSPAQGKYVSTLAAAERKEAEKRIANEYKDKPLVVTSVESVEGLRGGAPRTVSRELSGEEKDAEIARRAAAEVQTPWWSDPAEVEKRLKDPTRLTKPGVFEEETAFGTKRESNLGWLTRSAMMPLNAVAGALFPVFFTGLSEETLTPETAAAINKFGERLGLPAVSPGASESIEALRRQARPQAYKDSPVLLNIAEGRGFVGEAAELSKITGLDTEKLFGNVTIGDIYTAGAFAADLLDPSLDLVAGGVKGARVGKSAAEAAAKLGVKDAKKFGAIEGLKEAGRAVATENPALNLVAKRMGVEPGDIRIAISNKISDEASAALGTGRARTPNPTLVAGSPALRVADEQLKAFDQTLTGAAGGRGGLSAEEVRMAVGEALARNPSIPVDDIEGARIFNELKTNDALYSATQRAIVDNSIRRAVFQSTKDTVLKSGIVSVTRKIFATKDTAAKILKEYRTSPLAAKINAVAKPQNFTFGRDALVSTAGGGGRRQVVREGFKTDAATLQPISEESFRLYKAGFLTYQDYIDIAGKIAAGGDTFISSQSIRKLIDAGIEETAAKFKTIKSTDIAELNPIVSSELMKPIEIRDFSAPEFRNWVVTKGGLKVPKEVLTASQKAMYDEVVGRVSNLDKKLRGEVNRMLTDENFRAAYGVPADTKLTREQAVGYLVAGPRGTNRSQIADTLKLAVDKNFFQEKYVNDLFDIFSGIKLSESTDVWSVKGRSELMRLANEAASRISADPATYYAEMAKLIEDSKALLTDPTNVKVPESEIKSPKKQSNTETLIASYYEAESARAIREAMVKLVTDDADVLQTRAFQDAIINIGGRALANDNARQAAIVSNYVNKLLTDPSFATKDAVDRFAEIRGTFAAVTRDPEKRARFIAEVDGVARKILRNNRFDPIRNPVDEIEKVINKAFTDTELEPVVDAILGKEVANQIRSAVGPGNPNSIQAQLSRLIADSHKDKTVMDGINYLSDLFMSAFYTLVLTMAPRFHGANIVGAPSLIYSTTGRLLDPQSFISSLSAIKNADTATGAKVIVTDPAGRQYTANELYRAIVERGGQSVFRADLPSLQGRTAKAALEGPISRMRDWILSTPDKEDGAFRLAMAISALKEGRTLDEAASLARAALYDKGTMFDAEQKLQKLLLFYSFTRGNLVNLAKNLSKPEGLKRIINTVKFKRGVETMLVDPEEAKYAPETAATRIILGKTGTKDVGEKGVIIATPPDSTLSAMEMLISLVSGDIAGVASGMMKPGQAMLFKESTQNEVDKIPAEHVGIYNTIEDITGLKPGTLMSRIAGEEIIPVRSKDPDAVDGYIYPLLSPSAKKRYQLTLSALGYFGLGRIMTDYPNIFNVSGGKAATSFEDSTAGNVARALYNVGFISPLKTLSGEQQRLKNLMVQNSEGRKMVKDIDDIMLKGEIAPFTGDEAGYGAKIRFGQRAKAEGRLGIDELKREKMRLNAEIEGIKRQIMIDPARERRQIYLNQIYQKRDRIAEINKLQREATK